MRGTVYKKVGHSWSYSEQTSKEISINSPVPFAEDIGTIRFEPASPNHTRFAIFAESLEVAEEAIRLYREKFTPEDKPHD